MRHATKSLLLAAVILSLLLPVAGHAVPIMTCHCFTDRSYDAMRPAAADPYFLAAAQNAFIANVFSIDKKSIVMRKQQGTSSDDFWVAVWLASRSTATLNDLLQAKASVGAWKDVAAPLRLDPQTLGERVVAAISANAPTDRISAAVVDELFTRHQWMAEAELAALRKAGASNQEIILAAVVAGRLKLPPRQVYHEVTVGNGSWGALLDRAGIDAKNLQPQIATFLELSRR